MFNIILEQTLLCAITQFKGATKMIVVFKRKMKMKPDFSVLFARYGSMKNALENNFSANFKDNWLKFGCYWFVFA